jgi:hypothetical protein
VAGAPRSRFARARFANSRSPPIPRRMRPPAIRHFPSPFAGAPPPGPVGLGRAAHAGSTSTPSVAWKPPRPEPKNAFSSSGKPGTCVGSPVCPAMRKFSTYTPPTPRALSKKYDPSQWYSSGGCPSLIEPVQWSRW